MYSLMRSSSTEQSDSKTASSTSLSGANNGNADQMTKWMKDLHNFKVDRAEMNKVVMNYLVQEGFKDAAEKFRLESGLDPRVPLEMLDNRIKIRESVQSGQIDSAIDLTNNLNPDILDSKSHLFFHLQQQKLIELIREKNIDGALEFAQSVMSELGAENTSYLEELEKTMALLAYEDPTASPFSNLLTPSQRHMVASEVNAAILETQHQETMPKLAGVLKLLLWAQDELDRKHVKYPKMVDIAEGTIKFSDEKSSSSSSTP